MAGIHLMVCGGDSYLDHQLLCCGIETEIRIDRAITFLLQQTYDRAFIYLGAGHRPGMDTENTLAEAMRLVLKEKLRAVGLLDDVSIVTVREDVWGTIDESKAVAKELRLRGVESFFVITSWHHMFRVQKIWKLIKGFDVTPVYAKKKAGLKPLFYECVFCLFTSKDFEARSNGKKLKNPFY